MHMTPIGMSAAVGLRIRELRGGLGLSLSELARRAGIGKSSLSDIEAGRRNPTIETLYALCTPLGVPMTALIGVHATPMTTSGGGMTSTTLDVRELPDSTVEVFRLQFTAEADHTSPAHVPGVTEHLTVVAGTIRVGPVDALRTVRAGESTSWRSDRPHRYSAAAHPAEAVVVIVTPRTWHDDPVARPAMEEQL